MRILIIEDNADIAASIGDYLELKGWSVDYAYDGQMGLVLATENEFDVILLDINLPRMNGFDVCQKLRQEYQVDIPVLMLTARDSLADKITGFEMGAWDYLVKPFELKELEVRLQALRHRHTPNKTRELSIEDLVFNLDAWQASRAGKSLVLPNASLKILEMLMRASPNAVSRESLEYLLWGHDIPNDNNDPLRSHIHTLRHQIDLPNQPKLLHTLRGIGFALRTNN